MSKSKAKQRVKKLLEELNEKIDNVQSSEDFKELLSYFSKFHSYSFNNRILIQSQCPKATKVAGYNKWKEIGRYVMPKKERKKKGVRVKPIRILAPQFYHKTVKKVDKTDTEEIKKIRKKARKYSSYKIVNKNDQIILKQKKTYFKYVNVYDLSQTDGEPIPTLNMDMSDDMPELLKPLKNHTIEQGINLKFNKPANDPKLTPGTQGYSEKGRVVINTEKNHLTEQASILIHELAHEKLHDFKERAELTTEIKEMEADAVAYVVLNHFNIENPSDKYLALYKKDYDLKKSLDRISKISTEIIEKLDSYFENDDKKEQMKKTA